MLFGYVITSFLKVFLCLDIIYDIIVIIIDIHIL